MKTCSQKRFLKWARSHGMGLDERYPRSKVLTFKPDPGLDRFWEVPPWPEDRPHFLSMMLYLMGEWESCFVWRHLGSWPGKADPKRLNSKIESLIVKAAGVRRETSGILRFKMSQRYQLVTLLFSTTIFGFTTSDDLYVIPDHAGYILKFDHHGVVHASFRNEQDLQRFAKGMAEQDYPLPESVPDDTFKAPVWMKQDDKES